MRKVKFQYKFLSIRKRLEFGELDILARQGTTLKAREFITVKDDSWAQDGNGKVFSA